MAETSRARRGLLADSTWVEVVERISKSPPDTQSCEYADGIGGGVAHLIVSTMAPESLGCLALGITALLGLLIETPTFAKVMRVEHFPAPPDALGQHERAAYAMGIRVALAMLTALVTPEVESDGNGGEAMEPQASRTH